jgi:hypothetical protein
MRTPLLARLALVGLLLASSPGCMTIEAMAGKADGQERCVSWPLPGTQARIHAYLHPPPFMLHFPWWLEAPLFVANVIDIPLSFVADIALQPVIIPEALYDRHRERAQMEEWRRQEREWYDRQRAEQRAALSRR